MAAPPTHPHHPQELWVSNPAEGHGGSQGPELGSSATPSVVTWLSACCASAHTLPGPALRHDWQHFMQLSCTLQEVWQCPLLKKALSLGVIR